MYEREDKFVEIPEDVVNTFEEIASEIAELLKKLHHGASDDSTETFSAFELIENSRSEKQAVLDKAMKLLEDIEDGKDLDKLMIMIEKFSKENDPNEKEETPDDQKKNQFSCCI